MYMLSGAAARRDFNWLNYSGAMTTSSPCVGVSAVAMVAGSASVTQQPPDDAPRILK